VSRYVRPHRPVLISGAMSDWPAMMDSSRGRGGDEGEEEVEGGGTCRWLLGVRTFSTCWKLLARYTSKSRKMALRSTAMSDLVRKPR
jgi:hypothetical protein